MTTLAAACAAPKPPPNKVVDNSATRGRSGGASPRKNTAVYRETIEGRARHFTTQQLALFWWLYREAIITRRQLRIAFAACEMQERRRYTSEGVSRKPTYGIDELARLVGGRGSVTALRALKADAKHLAALGLVTIAKHELSIATSIGQLQIEQTGDFFAFLKHPVLEQGRGIVPVPRRTLRALAAGFGRAETGYMLAALMRSVFWRAKERRYRIDGRLKLSDVEDAFGISRRALTNARAKLIELGWLRPIETRQWERQRWGVHDVVEVDWALERGPDASPATDEGESASPHPQNAGESASPSKQVSSSRFITRTLGPRGKASSRPDQPGVSLERGSGSRKKKTTRSARRLANPDPVGEGGSPLPSTAPPNLRDIRSADLTDTERLLTLHGQLSQTRGFGPQISELDFVALANRARTRGNNPSKLFSWYLRNAKTAFITDSDEDAARARLRQHRREQPLAPGMAALMPSLQPPKESQAAPLLSEVDAYVVQQCVLLAKNHRVRDPFLLAQKGRGWTRKKWDDAYLRYRTMQAQQWHKGTTSC